MRARQGRASSSAGRESRNAGHRPAADRSGVTARVLAAMQRAWSPHADRALRGEPDAPEPLRSQGRPGPAQLPLRTLQPRPDAVPDALLRCSVTGVTITG
jgi:hypothetical protein